VRRKFDGLAAGVLLRWAVVLHRTVAGRAARDRQIARRDAAIRGAHRRGVPVEVLAARMRLTPSWIRQVLNGKKPPEVEATA
jgi:hypothetical protein